MMTITNIPLPDIIKSKLTKPPWNSNKLGLKVLSQGLKDFNDLDKVKYNEVYLKPHMLQAPLLTAHDNIFKKEWIK